MVSRHALRVWIEGRFSINEKLVVMMPVRERHLDSPSAVVLPLHRMRALIPIVEIAHQENFPGVGSHAKEVHRLGHFLGGVTVQWGVCVAARVAV